MSEQRQWCVTTSAKCSHTVLWVTLIAKFTGPTWAPSGADRTQVVPMLAPWTLLSGDVSRVLLERDWTSLGIAYNTAVINAEHKSEFKLTADTLYLALTGKLWDVCCEFFFWENRSLYNGTALCISWNFSVRRRRDIERKPIQSQPDSFLVSFPRLTFETTLVMPGLTLLPIEADWYARSHHISSRYIHMSYMYPFSPVKHYCRYTNVCGSHIKINVVIGVA